MLAFPSLPSRVDGVFICFSLVILPGWVASNFELLLHWFHYEGRSATDRPDPLPFPYPTVSGWGRA